MMCVCFVNSAYCLCVYLCMGKCVLIRVYFVHIVTVIDSKAEYCVYTFLVTAMDEALMYVHCWNFPLFICHCSTLSLRFSRPETSPIKTACIKLFGCVCSSLQEYRTVVFHDRKIQKNITVKFVKVINVLKSVCDC